MSVSVTSTSRRRAGALLAIAATGATIALAPSASAATSSLKPVFAGNSYGTTISLAGVVGSGTTANNAVCTTKVPSTHTIHTAEVNLPGGIGTIGAIDTTVETSRSASASATTTTTTTASTTLFGGLLELSGITTVAKARHTSAGYTMSADTTLLGLKIAGVPVPIPDPTKTWTMPIPGIGDIVANFQNKYNVNGTHEIGVTGLKIEINANLLNIPTGKIVIGHGEAALHDAMNSPTSGGAYGSRIVIAGGIVRSGPTAAAYLPCGGSGGNLVGNRTVSVNIPSVLNTGVVASHSRSTDTAGSTVAATNNQAASINLFDQVKLTALTSRAEVTRTAANKLVRSAAGTSFLGLTIAGKTYSADVPANTVKSLPGLGTLYLNRQLKTPNGLHVIGLQLVLGQAVGALPAGASIIISSAEANVAPR